MLRRYYTGLGGKRLARFFTPTPISGDSSQDTEQSNLYGLPGASLTIKVITLTNSNSLGRLYVNGSQVFLNNTFPVSLDGSGRGSFLARVQGDPTDHGSIVLGRFQIIFASIGDIAPAPKDQYQISKAFI